MPDGNRVGVHTVAIFEAAKGALVLLAGFGLLALVRRDAQEIAESFVERMHLNPAKGYPHIFLDVAASITDARLWSLAALAFAYASIRFLEAWGLWRDRPWAEWLAALSGGIYLPVEIYEMAVRITWVKAVVFVVNAGIVGYMVYLLWHRRRAA